MPTRHAAAIGALFLCFAGTVLAGPTDEARSHFNAIGSGDVANIMRGYAADAHFEWVGGPLNGTYVGSGKIKEVWGKFAKTNAPLKVSVSKLEESANPSGATVTANVEFRGKNTIKVRYVLTYREGRLVNEVWQIDPKLAVY